MKRGFSLFEVLLVLLIASMIIVGGIEYAKRRNETTAAEQLGHRLYLYAVAVSDYARQNPEKLSGTVEHYGVDWLKNEPNPENCTNPLDITTCKTFLGQDFNLNFQSLILETFPGAPNVADAQIFTRLIALPTPSLSLEVEFIQLGRVLRYGGSGQYSIDVSLSTRAINFANNYTDQFGTSPVTYAMTTFDAEGYIIGQPGGPGVDVAYLLTSGGNTMKGSIRFEPTAEKKNMEGVDTIIFTAKAPSTATTSINKIENIATGSAVLFPDANNEGNDGKQPGYVGDDFVVYREKNGVAWMQMTIPGSSPAENFNTSNSLCVLSGMQKAGDEGNDTCRVTPSTDANKATVGDWVVYLHKGKGTSNTSSCYARCLVFN